MKKWIKPVVLNGEHVILKPLELSQCKALQDAVCDGELWKLWYTRIPEQDQMTAEVCRRLEQQ